jgi:hypothetical protein
MESSLREADLKFKKRWKKRLIRKEENYDKFLRILQVQGKYSSKEKKVEI